MNPGARLIADITLSNPIVVTTVENHPYATGDVIIIKVPKEDGLQNPSAPVFKQEDFFVRGIITNNNPITFTIPGNTVGLTPFSGTLPAWAIPSVYSCSQYATSVFNNPYRLIAHVSRSSPAVVTTSIPHTYVTGTIVRLMVPKGVGMFQADKLYGSITVTSPTTFTIPIDSTNFDAFVLHPEEQSAAPYINVCALTIPIGEDTAQLNAATRNIL